MKYHRLFFSILFALCISCNNNKEKSGGNIGKIKDNYLNDASTNNTNSGNPSASKWTPEDVAAFSKECRTNFLKENIDEQTINKLCPCIMEKMSAKYATYAELDKNGTSQEGEEIMKQCVADLGLADNGISGNANRWSPEQESDFVRDCKTEAAKNMGTEKAGSYCSCMLQKIEKIYPSYEEANDKIANLTKEQLSKMAADCIK
ncbi:MAG: hypothetical protein JST23_11435 [Bacteroidetes bacterium]|nr:hypothetical protein [Bacteroidota bacterium]